MKTTRNAARTAHKDIAALHAKAHRLEQDLQETLDLLAQETHAAEAVTAELVRTRGYAFNAAADPVEEAIAGCVDSLSRYGFCVLDNVIPSGQVDEIRDEVVTARSMITRNVEGIKNLFAQEGASAEDLLSSQAAAHNLELRPVRRVGHPPKPPNDIVWMPKYAQHLAHPVVTAVARRVLDDHLRIAQLQPRFIPADAPHGTVGGFGSVKHRGRADSREWHTDWPHDLSAYGMEDPNENAGCVRQPFPDVTMCLVMIWYLTDVDENSGGTWIVPGSHRDKRNPRGPDDGISTTAPIPGDMQVSAPAGSVYIQDSRCWHASAMHNPSGRDRAAMVNRWCPWWLSVDDYAPGDKYSTNVICRPLSHAEYLSLPTDLQPMMRHLCPDERDTLQQPVLERAAAASLRTQAGFRQLEENADGRAEANAHIRVPLRPSRD
jgi:ectoine hydroxylase-related dioxygenase (phytanoyl-CoA dioxygenase family)